MTVEIPGYRILSTLGKGGMATVYLAEHELFQRKVALKVMSPSLADDPSFGQRFMREARIVSQLVHPNIVTVYDVGVHEGKYYLSMEYIDGKDLKHARHELTLEQKILIILDIAKALAYAGNKGYVHRDIKPENIMLYRDDNRAVLTDFGIARAAELDTAVTQTGTAIGTPHYMSPEQAKGQQVDIRSDVYGLGVVFYLMLVGCVPFDAESAVAIGIKHITDPVPELPEGLEDLQPILDRMLAKLPQDRYQTPAQLVKDLSALDLHRVIARADEAYREAEGALQGDADAPTIISRPVAQPRPRITDPRAAVEPEPTPLLVEEPFELDEEPSNAWPWVAGVLVLVAVVGGVYYAQNTMKPDGWPVEVRDLPATATEPLQPQVPSENGQVAGQEAGEEPSAAGEEPSAAGQEPSAAGQEPPVARTEEPSARLGEPSAGVEEPSAGVEEPSAGGEQPSAPVEQRPTDETLAGAPQQAQVPVQVRVEELKQRLAELRDQVATDPAVLSALLATSNQLQTLAPDSLPDEVRPAALLAEEVERVRQLARAGELEAARERLQNLQTVTTEVHPKDLSDLRSLIAQQTEVNQLIVQGRARLEEDKLTLPEGDSAVDFFQQALAVDSGNTRAQAGITAVAERLVELAQGAVDTGDVSRAQTLLRRALEIDPGNTSAVAAQGALEQQKVQVQERVAELLGLANRQIEEANYFSPVDTSAYRYFTRVLELQPSNAAAQRGIERTFEGFEKRLFNLLAENHIQYVREQLVKARSVLPDSQRLAALDIRVEEAIAEKILAAQPRITHILVSGTAVDDPSGPQLEPVMADRSVNVAFRYENFDGDATVLQAILLDGTGSVQIAQTPVVVTGEAGSKSFRIDRPVQGFPPGQYSVDIMHGERILASRNFRVQ